jgi:uncharacterized protein (DUF697 family)
MAIDPARFDNAREFIREVVDYAPVDQASKHAVEETLIEHLIGDLEPFIDESRPPRLYIFGRSGAGKSSLINALAKKEVASVGAIRPETEDSEKYEIQFSDRYATWDVVDSRGLFESIPANEEVPGGTVDAIAKDVQEYRPDILIHVMTPGQARAGKHDFEAVERLEERIPGGLPPLLYCINQVDNWLPPGHSVDPDQNDEFADHLIELLDFVAEDLLGEVNHRPFDYKHEYRGYVFDSERHVGVFPTYAMQDPYWNVDTLSELMCEYLPEEAVLQFAQAQRRDRLMRSIARRQTNRLAATAAVLGGADSTGVSDILLLTPLQVGLVVIIGSLSCEEFSVSTAHEYFAELGAVGSAGLGLRKLAGAVAGVVPGPGQVVNAGIAFAGTYAVGRSAEAYFFDDEFTQPKEYMSAAKDRFGDIL